MKLQKVLMILLGMVIIGIGCEPVKNPTSPNIGDKKQVQQGLTEPSDDTRDSDIVLSPSKTYIITAVGDSITYGTGASSWTGGYPGMLRAKLSSAGYNVVVYNEGIPGIVSETADNYFEWMVTGSDIALIMIGANDVLGCSGSDCYTIEHIRSMVDKALRLNVIPVLGTVTPKRSGDKLDWANPAVEALNSQIFALAAEYQIKVADTYNAILNHGGDSLFSDAHHFTDQGYDVIANEWYNVLAGMLFKPL
jgi:lysophospholipase L1-like esterase